MMIKDLKELGETLDANVKPLVDAIKAEDPTGARYKELLENFNATLTVSSNITRMLMAAAAQAKKESEDKKDESNN